MTLTNYRRITSQAKGAVQNILRPRPRGRVWWAYSEGKSRIFYTQRARFIFMQNHPEYWLP